MESEHRGNGVLLMAESDGRSDSESGDELLVLAGRKEQRLNDMDESCSGAS